MLLLYRLITCLALAGAPLYALTVLARRPNRWREVGERFGFLPRQIGRDTAGAIWLQASSVGELQVALARLKTRLAEIVPADPISEEPTARPIERPAEFVVVDEPVAVESKPHASGQGEVFLAWLRKLSE